jgi:ATP-binding protein involved in chromosome partitioning
MPKPASLAEEIREILARLNVPAELAALEAGDGAVRLVLEVDPALGSAAETWRQQVEQAVTGLGGVASASVILTAQKPAPQMAQAGPHGRIGPKRELAGVRHIIAVASGKGGVGKSTTAVNLALGLMANGVAAGLLDADIYGPSLPRLLGISGAPEVTAEKRIVPHVVHGMPVMSMGFLVPEEKATIWRGAMVQGALQQLLHQVAWNRAGDLEVLVVDLPPGTGDAHLTLAQQVPLAGAVIVSTPQDIALIDARKALQMFQRLDVPVLGIIENMSFYCCEKCGHRADIFGHGGAAEEARRLGVPFLAEIPLDIRLRETGDAGTPIVLDDPDGAHTRTYRAIARGIMESVGR